MDDLLDLNFSSTPQTSSTLRPKPLTPSQSSRTTSPAIPPTFDFLSTLSSSSASSPLKPDSLSASKLNPNQANLSGLNLLRSGNLTPTPLSRSGSGSGSGSGCGTPLNGIPSNSTSSLAASGQAGKLNTTRGGSDPFAGLWNLSPNPAASSSVSTSISPNPNQIQPFPKSASGSGYSTPQLSSTSSAVFSQNSNLTLLQRQQLLAQQKKEKEEKDRRAFDFDNWNGGGSEIGNGGSSIAGLDGLEALGGLNILESGNGNGNTKRMASSSGNGKRNDNDDLQNFKTPQSDTNDKKTNSKPSIDLLSSPPYISDSKDPFDLLTSSPASSSSHKVSTTSSATRLSSTPPTKRPKPPHLTSGSIDSRSGSGLGKGAHKGNGTVGGVLDDDDILGLLGKPAVEKGMGTGVKSRREVMNGEESLDGRMRESPRPKSPSRKPRPTTSAASKSSGQSRPPSPPPHVLGRIVEMGFSPAQARKALAQTETGLDVEGALEILLGGGSGSGNGSGERRDGRGDRDQGEVMFDAEEEARERRRRRRQGPSRDSNQTSSNTNSREPKPPLAPPENGDRSTSIPDYTEQADKIISQASEIGLSMFNKANSLWSSGKEKARVLYEERQKADAAKRAVDGSGSGSGSGGGPSRFNNGGKPKWMVDAEEAEADAENKMDRRDRRDRKEQARMEAEETFKDSDEEGPEDVLPRSPHGKQSMKEVVTKYRNQEERRTAEQDGSRQQKEADLLGGTSTIYRSPARRRPVESALRTPARDVPTATLPTAKPKAALIKRHVASVSPDQLQRSSTHKQQGNDHFKLGRFAEASISYTSAISALPPRHLLAIPLNTNRAASLLKSGDHSEAIKDCTIVIEMIGPEYHPSKEEPISGEASDVNLADGLFKAFSKRASAYEMGEKWEKAKEDWERIMTLPVANIVFAGPSGSAQRKMVSEGMARSRKMCEVLNGGGGKLKPVVTPTPQARPPPPLSSSQRPNPMPPPKATPAPSSKITDTTQSAGVAKMRQAASLAEKEDDLRLSLKDSVDTKLSLWSKGKETNIRGLLGSLDMVLWESLGLKKVGMGELISEKQVKVAYMRVIGKLHPDKLNTNHTTLEHRMLANGVFGTLNEAWHAFLSSN